MGYDPAHGREIGTRSFKVPSNPSHSMVLFYDYIIRNVVENPAVDVEMTKRERFTIPNATTLVKIHEFSCVVTYFSFPFSYVESHV